jgi:hypothetical protein
VIDAELVAIGPNTVSAPYPIFLGNEGAVGQWTGPITDEITTTMDRGTGIGATTTVEVDRLTIVGGEEVEKTTPTVITHATAGITITTGADREVTAGVEIETEIVDVIERDLIDRETDLVIGPGRDRETGLGRNRETDPAKGPGIGPATGPVIGRERYHGIQRTGIAGGVWSTGLGDPLGIAEAAVQAIAERNARLENLEATLRATTKESGVAVAVLMRPSRTTLLNPLGGKNPESVEVAAEAMAGAGRIGRRSAILAAEAAQRVPAARPGSN